MTINVVTKSETGMPARPTTTQSVAFIGSILIIGLTSARFVFAHEATPLYELGVFWLAALLLMRYAMINELNWDIRWVPTVITIVTTVMFEAIFVSLNRPYSWQPVSLTLLIVLAIYQVVIRRYAVFNP